ncbi:MAG: hypothetical protein H7138_26210 [Myxococcales bacterium]|nr:hypothetical protein [Myxococcales bacterium]
MNHPSSAAPTSTRALAAHALWSLALLGACKGGDPASTAGTSSDTGQPTASSSGVAETSTGVTGSSSDTGVAETSESGAIEDLAPFTITALDHPWLSSFRASQSADAEVDLGAGPFTSVELVVELESPCYPFDKWERDPPPEGHNWPATCDAFDRIVDVTADPTGEGGPPDFELMRGITPFGGPHTYTVDLTGWSNAHPGTHTDAVPPFAIELAQLGTPGMHTFDFAIAGIAEGGVWPTSAIVYAYGG